MNLRHQLLFISVSVIVTVIMITSGWLIQNFLISSQVDKEFITKNVNTSFLRLPDELVCETVNYPKVVLWKEKTLENMSVTLFVRVGTIIRLWFFIV